MKKIFATLLVITLYFSLNMVAFASEETTSNEENITIKEQTDSYPPVTIGSRIGYGEAYGKGYVRVYITLNQNYSKGIVVRAGAVGNDTPYSCSVVCPDGTARVLCREELHNLHANGDRTDYVYISYGSAGTYEFVFHMQDSTKTTGCAAWIYEVTG